jgi:hypothetical protein
MSHLESKNLFDVTDDVEALRLGALTVFRFEDLSWKGGYFVVSSIWYWYRIVTRRDRVCA